MSTINQASKIEYMHYNFLITDTPTDDNLPAYISLFKKRNVAVVVRLCEPTYNSLPIEKSHIKVIDLPFTDGQSPDMDIVNKWINVVETYSKNNKNSSEKKTIAVHCTAGLGRAPTMVAISLIEAGMDPINAIQFIRDKRRGAFNTYQLNFIREYKPNKKQWYCIIL